MFTTILFPTWEQHQAPRQEQMPESFKDLNIDQIVNHVLGNKLNWGLESFYYTPLSDESIVHFRQDVMRDLEDAELLNTLSVFSEAAVTLINEFASVREALTAKTTYENDYLTRGRMLNHTAYYCALITQLASSLSVFKPKSQGLKDFIEFLTQYAASSAITNLSKELQRLSEEFSKVRYCLLMKTDNLKLRKYDNQPRQADAIDTLFERFKTDRIPNYHRYLSEEPSARKIEAMLLQMVSELYPKLFGELDDFCAANIDFMDETVIRFSKEIRFYIAWLNYTQPMVEAGLDFCYPEVTKTAADLYSYRMYDLALAAMIGKKIVPNDFTLNGQERILVVTGPNQGGKTTFARSFGQSHWFASLGVRVQGQKARLALFDHILTHFEKEEDLTNLSGKLQDDLIRLKSILDKGTSNSIYLINEIYTSTTLTDALTLGKYMMDAIVDKGGPAIIVTFLDELAAHGPETVSMVTLMKDDSSEDRTFKVVRRAPDGQAFAIQIAARHNLTYDQIKKRILA